MAAIADGYDRTAALKEFDETKVGVKGLIESGVTTVPRIFRHPTPRPSAVIPVRSDLSIPSIDLSLPSPALTDLVRSAATNWGFFQVTNHGIPLPAVSAAVSAIRSFHNLPPADRSRYYSRAPAGGVSYISNVDLFRSGAASWRDTLQVMTAPAPPDPSRIPDVCRADLMAWDGHAAALGRRLMGLLSEGLGVGADRLEGLSCVEGRVMACHYYPQCPEPEATEGLADHTDPGVLTVLVQDHIGGLQVKWRGDDGEVCWVDVKPDPKALVINVGDLCQIISNDIYKSVEHRVLANPHQEARVSVAMFFNPGKRAETDLYGPLPELVSPENPAHYRNFTMTEFMTSFFGKGLKSKALLDHFKLV